MCVLVNAIYALCIIDVVGALKNIMREVNAIIKIKSIPILVIDFVKQAACGKSAHNIIQHCFVVVVVVRNLFNKIIA